MIPVEARAGFDLGMPRAIDVLLFTERWIRTGKKTKKNETAGRPSVRRPIGCGMTTGNAAASALLECFKYLVDSQSFGFGTDLF